MPAGIAVPSSQRRLRSQRHELLGQPPLAAPDALLDVAEDDVRRLLLQAHGAARRQVGETSLDLRDDLARGAPEHRAEPPIEPELPACRPDETDGREARFGGGEAQPSTELLKEDRGALRRPKEEDGVDAGYVDAFVEQVDGEDDL